MADAIAELLEASKSDNADPSASDNAATDPIQSDAEGVDAADKSVDQPEPDEFESAKMFLKMRRNAPTEQAGSTVDPQAAAIEEKAEEYLSADDYATLEDQVGTASAEIIKKLVAVIASKDQDIKSLKGFRTGLEKLGGQLAPLTGMAAAETRRQISEAHTALDEIAKHGGAEFFGANKADRSKNVAAYGEKIKLIWADATDLQNRDLEKGVDKSIGHYLKFAWNLWAEKPLIPLGDEKPAVENKKTGESTAAKAAMVKAAQEQAKRVPPIRAKQMQAPTVQQPANSNRPQRGIPAEDMEIMNRFLSPAGA